MLGKVILWVSALAFIPYGLMCLYSPSIPAEFGGFEIITGDGFAEIGAMYGGLQTGYGLFCLWGALRAELFRPALLSLVLLVGGLAAGRLYSTMTGMESVGGYTYGAMTFEFSVAILAWMALRKSQ
jgi:hypothetical protein